MLEILEKQDLKFLRKLIETVNTLANDKSDIYLNTEGWFWSNDSGGVSFDLVESLVERKEAYSCTIGELTSNFDLLEKDLQEEITDEILIDTMTRGHNYDIALYIKEDDEVVFCELPVDEEPVVYVDVFPTKLCVKGQGCSYYNLWEEGIYYIGRDDIDLLIEYEKANQEVMKNLRNDLSGGFEWLDESTNKLEGYLPPDLIIEGVLTENSVVKEKKKSAYDRSNVLKHKEYIDFYDLLFLIESDGSKVPHEIAHAVKKLLYQDRGHKNNIKDAKEAIWSINKWLENQGEISDNAEEEL